MKYFIFILLMLSCSASAFGQHTATVRWGFVMTKIDGDSYFSGLSITPRKSVRIGASIDVPIRDRLSLQIGGDYVPKGAEDPALYGSGVKLHIDYIEFSGLGVFWLLPPRRTPSLFMLAGPTVAFKVRADEKNFFLRTYPENYSQDLKAMDFGIAGGIGAQIPILKAIAIKAELLYTLGIQSVNNATFNMKNHAISFCIGLGFPVSRLGGG